MYELLIHLEDVLFVDNSSFHLLCHCCFESPVGGREIKGLKKIMRKGLKKIMRGYSFELNDASTFFENTVYL